MAANAQVQKEDWRADLLSKPSISVRKGIAFGYEGPSEDTSTIVLTTPAGRFVDIRFPTLQSWRPSTPVTSMPSFWVLSGVSRTTFYDRKDDVDPGFPYTSHTVFTHDIDSKGPGIVDEGDDILLPNGDVIEVGIWPENGKLYKELWTQHEILPGRDRLRKRPVVVAETKNHKVGRGIMLRVGDIIQGIYEFNNDAHSPSKLSFVRVLLLPQDDPSAEWHEERTKEPGKIAFSIDDRTWIEDIRNSEEEGCLPWNEITKRELDLGLEFENVLGQWSVTEYLGEE